MGPLTVLTHNSLDNAVHVSVMQEKPLFKYTEIIVKDIIL